MRKIIFKFLRYSGLPLLFRELIQRRKVTILLFHDLSIQSAELTFRYLKKHYNVIDLDYFLISIMDKYRQRLPKKSMIITFDDGHFGNYDLLPLIKESGIEITIFLCAGIINTKRKYWFQNLVAESEKKKLKKMKNSERLRILSGFGYTEKKEYDTSEALNKKQIEEMGDHVNFQSHSLFHPILTNCSTEDAANEIFESKKVLENQYNLSINTFSYPNGDYSEREVELIEAAGYSCGITVDYGFNDVHTNQYKLKRISLKDHLNADELIVKSSGVWGLFKNISRK